LKESLKLTLTILGLVLKYKSETKGESLTTVTSATVT